MDKHAFQQQMNRLKAQWGDHNYKEDRLNLFWNALRNDSDEVLRVAVDHLIAYHQGSAPAMGALEKAVDQARTRVAQARSQEAAGFHTVVSDAAAKNTTADPDFVKACMKLLSDYWGKKITRPNFEEGCGLLQSVADQINPIPKQHRPVYQTTPSWKTGRDLKTGEKEQ